jgi:hypothetical protein
MSQKYPDFTAFRVILGIQDIVHVARTDTLVGFGPIMDGCTEWHWNFFCDVVLYVPWADVTFTYLK